jgi:hypothetical protein
MKIHSAVLELFYVYRWIAHTYIVFSSVANAAKNGRNYVRYVQTEETRKEFKQTKILMKEGKLKRK